MTTTTLAPPPLETITFPSGQRHEVVAADAEKLVIDCAVAPMDGAEGAACPRRQRRALRGPIAGHLRFTLNGVAHHFAAGDAASARAAASILAGRRRPRPRGTRHVHARLPLPRRPARPRRLDHAGRMNAKGCPACATSAGPAPPLDRPSPDYRAAAGLPRRCLGGLALAALTGRRMPRPEQRGDPRRVGEDVEAVTRPSAPTRNARIDRDAVLVEHDARAAVDQRGRRSRPASPGARRTTRLPATALGALAPAARRRRRRRAGRRPGRAAPAGPRSRRRARRPGTRRRPRAAGGEVARPASARALDAPAGAAGELAGRGGRAVRRSARSRRTARANMSCSTNASRSAGASVVEHDQQREPDRVGRAPPRARDRRRRLGSRPGPARATSSGSSRRVFRERSMVEAHPGDDRRQPAAEVLDVRGVGAAEPEPAPPARRRRPRCASRASGRRPPRRCVRCSSKRSCQQSSSFICHILPSRSCHASDRPTTARCDTDAVPGGRHHDKPG